MNLIPGRLRPPRSMWPLIPSSPRNRTTFLVYLVLVVLTVALVCILTASLVSIEDVPMVAVTKKSRDRIKHKSWKKKEDPLRTYRFTDGALTVPKTGFPPENPTHDLNGFRINLVRDTDADGFSKMNKHCSQKMTCEVAPHLLELKASDPPCSAFEDIFDYLRECEEKRKLRIRNWKNCKDTILDSGFWRNVYKIDFEGKPIVIKALRGKHIHGVNNLLRHIREAKLLELLRGNPYVVNSVAHCYNVSTHEFALMTIYFPKGSLLYFVESGGLADLSVKELLDWTLQLARGVEAIHEVNGGPYVHADLQLRQVMIADDNTLKLNDFNRGKWIPHDEEGVGCAYCGSKSKGKWRAPEEYTRGVLDEKLDIYSMGMMIWALWSNTIEPFSSQQKEDVYEYVPKGMRPRLPEHAPERIQRVIQNCWEGEPAKRPSARWVANEIENIMSVLPAEVLERHFIDCEFDVIEQPKENFQRKHKPHKKRRQRDW